MQLALPGLRPIPLKQDLPIQSPLAAYSELTIEDLRSRREHLVGMAEIGLELRQERWDELAWIHEALRAWELDGNPGFSAERSNCDL
jgi:hypothetical protein